VGSKGQTNCASASLGIANILRLDGLLIQLDLNSTSTLNQLDLDYRSYESHLKNVRNCTKESKAKTLLEEKGCPKQPEFQHRFVLKPQRLRRPKLSNAPANNASVPGEGIVES